MKRHHLIGTLCAVMFTAVTLSANASLIGILPATMGDTDWQAYYDDQLDITWTANANINGLDTWNNQETWAAALDIDGVTGWRLPNMDINGDDTIVDCSSGSNNQTACMDNEYGHLYYYGEGTTQFGGITTSSTGPFSNIQSAFYWSSTELATDPTFAWDLPFNAGIQNVGLKSSNQFAWAVHDGDISAVPIPAAVWLFGSGLVGLIGVARRKKAA